MKKTILTLITIIGFGQLFAQKMIDKQTFQMDSITLKVGDDIQIGKPSAYDFVNVDLSKSGFSLSKLGKIANVAGAVGSTVGLAGAQVGNIGAMNTGLKVMQGAETVGGVGMTADAIDALNVSNKAKQIIGKTFRILKFKEEGNDKRGHHIYAIAAGEGNKNYKIEIAPALESREVNAYRNNS